LRRTADVELAKKELQMSQSVIDREPQVEGSHSTNVARPQTVWAGAVRGRSLILMPTLSMRQLLVALVLATTAPLLVLALVMYQQMVALERQAARDALMGHAEALVALVDNEIDTHLAVAATLATSPALQSGDMVAFHQQARQALEFIPGAWLSLCDPSGKFLMTTLDVGAPLSFPDKQEIGAKARATGKSQLSDIVTSAVVKRPHAFIEHLVFKAGAPLYTILLGLNPDRFHALLRERSLDSRIIGILDRQSKFVARIPDHDIRVGTPASEGWQAAIARAPRGFTENATLEGDLSLTAYAPTRDGWTVGIAVPMKLLDAPVRHVLWSMGLMGFGLTLVSLILGHGLGRRLNRVMTGLVAKTQKIGRGEIVAAKSFAVREASAISTALSAASHELANRQAALRESEKRLQLALEAARLGWWQYDPVRRFASWDARYKEIFGISDENNDFDAAFSSLHPDDVSVVQAAVECALDPVDPQPYAAEYRILWPDGSVRWVEAHGLATFDVLNGKRRATSLVGTVADITARKAAEHTLQAAHDTFRRLVENSPFGVYAIDADFRLMQVSAGAQKVFEHVRPLIGRNFAEVLRCIWPEPFASEAIGHFRHTLETGELYHAPSTVEHRRDIDEVESYDWKIERVIMPDGRFGVVCHFYDLSERQRHEAALREGEERLRLASEAAGFGVHDFNVARQESTWSSGMHRILGTVRSGPVSMAVWLATVHPDDRVRVRAEMEAFQRRLGHYEIECRIVRPDGAVRWVLDRGEATGPRDADTGKVTRVMGTLMDITQQKAREERVQLLIREVNHRSKNMLAIVQAIARQTAASEPEHFVSRFSERIQALAANQDLLVRNEWRGVGIYDLVRAQLTPFADLMATRITVDGPDIQMSAAAAQAIGMVLHELATNAGKYGALSTSVGQVDLSWRLAPGRPESRFAISWSERDGPPVEPPTRKGFGNTVLLTMAKMSLLADVNIDYASTGVIWRLECPAQNVIECDV
jgi:PAS domain S-box-containing protein